MTRIGDILVTLGIAVNVFNYFISFSSCNDVLVLLFLLYQNNYYAFIDSFVHLFYSVEQVAGHGIRPFVLSRKFWHDASSSPFPIDSGKRAADFSSWLTKQEKNLREDGVNLTEDLQCGEIFHLFALVYSGELFIYPVLPKEGVGEADEPNNSKSSFPMEQIQEVDDPKVLKRKSDKVKLSTSEKFKKQKTQARIDANLCSRREKGFPGISVILNRATFSRGDAIQCFTDEHDLACSLSYDENNQGSSYTVETIGIPSLSEDSILCQNYNGIIQSVVPHNELPWDAMATYAVQMSSVFVGGDAAITFSHELFKSVHSAICQSGEQGLEMEEISEVTKVQGMFSYILARIFIVQFLWICNWVFYL